MPLTYEIRMSHRLQCRSVRKSFSKADWDRVILPILTKYNAVLGFKFSVVSMYEVTLGHDEIMTLHQELATGYRRISAGLRHWILLKDGQV